jgi:hypothetical protein
MLAAAATLALLAAAFLKTRPAAARQGAVSLSRPGQEDLTFWVNHNGLEQLDVEGPVGFGDMARLLLRRRANAEKIRALRDRFTFRVQEMAALDTPDVFRAAITASGLEWRSKPERLIVMAGATFNLPLIVENRTGASAVVDARFTGTTAESAFPPQELAADAAGGYFLGVVESKPGAGNGRLVLRAGGREIEAGVTLDVRAPVHLTVDLVDGGGPSVPARVYITGADGLAYTPRGHVTRIAAMSADYYFHANGSFHLDLPAGPTLIETTRGPEYELDRRSVNLEPGYPARVRLDLKRWIFMAGRSWFSADAHIHANYTAPHHQVITPEDVRLQTLGEDLNNANMMVANSSGAFLHDLQYFDGKPNALSRPGYVIYWNEEMRNSGQYGHMCFFNLKQLVAPLYTGFRGTPHWEDYPANYALAQDAQRQGGAVTWAHPSYAPNFDRSSMRELPVDLALGSGNGSGASPIDAMDVLSNDDEPASMALWYRLLNCGFRLAISAGTDSFTNVADHYTPGGGRVYVHTAMPMQYGQWIQDYKRGRSFASNGPMIFFTVNGEEPGAEIRLPAGPQKVRVKATVETREPVDTVDIVVNGKAVVSRAAAGKQTITIDEEIPLERSAWIAARATGPWSRLILNDLQTWAHTSPVYVYLGQQKIRSREDAQFWVAWIEQLIARVNERGRFATPERKKEVVAQFERALDVYRQMARNPVQGNP